MLLTVLLICGLAGLAWLVWSGVDRLGEGSLLSNSYPLHGLPTCWRCGGEQANDDGVNSLRCRRCRCFIQRSGEVVVQEFASSWLIHPKVQDHSYRQLEARTTDGGFFRIIIPGNVSFQPGNRVVFVCCRAGHLRAVENVSAGTGWRLPSRALGERSRLLGAAGVLALSAGAPLFVLVALGLALLGSLLLLVNLAELVSTGSWGGGGPGSEIEAGRNSAAQVVIFLGAAILAAVGAMAWRGRPSINRNFLN